MSGEAVADEILIGYLVESTLGVIPTSAIQEVRITGETLKSDITKSESNEIRSDRNVDDIYATAEQAVGGTQHLLSYGNTDQQKENALASSFSAPYNYSALTISIDETAGVLTLNDASGGFLPSNLLVGSYFRFQTVGALNPLVVFARVVSVDVNNIVFTTKSTIVDEIAGTAVTIDHNGVMRDGKEKKSLTFEKEFTDVAKFFNSVGMVASTYTLEIGNGAPVTEVFEYLGLRQRGAVATVGTGSNLPAPTNLVMVAGQHTKNIDINGADLCFSSVNLTVDNSVQGRPQVNDIVACSFAERKRKVSGSFGTYFKDLDFYNLYQSNGSFGITLPVIDALGQGYLFSVPDCKLENDGDILATASDSDVTPSFDFKGVALDKDYVVQITRFAQLP